MKEEHVIKPDCAWNENLGLWLSSQNNDNKRHGSTASAKTTIGVASSARKMREVK